MKKPEKGGDLAAYYFHQGTNFHAYDYLGVQKQYKSIIITSDDSTLMEAVAVAFKEEYNSNNLLRPDCYFILENNIIKSFDNTTDKEIRQAHNLEKMYKGGEFEVKAK